MTTRAICRWGDEEKAKMKLQDAMANLSAGRIESWRFTPIGTALQQQMHEAVRASGSESTSITVADDGIYINIAKGTAQAQDNDVQKLQKEGVHIYSQQQKAGQLMLSSYLGYVVNTFDSPVATLNAAYTKDVLVIAVDEGVVLKKPIFLRAKTQTVIMRVLVVVSSRGQCELVEEYKKDSCDGMMVPVVEIILGEEAQCRHYKMQSTAKDGVHLATTGVQVASNALYKRMICQTGAKLARDEVQVYSVGKNTEIEVAGVYIGTEKQHLDQTVLVKHQEESAVSRQVYRGVLTDSACGVFQGKIHVDKIAQQTDGYQINRTITLSDKAVMYAKPELEIYADDVKCSHGSIMGSLDDDELYYLRSRGVSKHRAKKLLLRAHVDDVLTAIENQAIRDSFCCHVEEVLDGTSFRSS